VSTFDIQDEILFKVHTRIATQGVCVEYAFGDRPEPDWAYTIGLLDIGHPEVIVFGLDEHSTAYAIECLLYEIRAGYRRPVGRNRRQPRLGKPGVPVRLVPVPDHYWGCSDESEHRLCIAHAYYRALSWDREELHAVQLVWASRAGKFPWHASASTRDRARQPLLDRPARTEGRSPGWAG
jgi:hypothetical protein